MGNSISLNFLADEGHLTVNSQRLTTSQLASPLSPRSDSSSQVPHVSSVCSDSDENIHNINKAETPAENLTTAPKIRQCWICYGEEEISDKREFVARWVSPCNCKGTTKWVHQACLLDWIDSQVMNNATLATNRNSPAVPAATSPQQISTTSPGIPNTQPAPRFQAGDGPLVLESVKLSCPQCHAPYIISEAHALPRRVLLFIDSMSRAKERALLWSTFGLVSGSVYTVAFSYGLFTGWMVGGQEYLEFIRESLFQGSLLTRLQFSAAIPMSPLFALSSAFSMFTWTFPLVPLFLFDGKHRISLTQPRGILLFLPLIWSTHQILVDSLIPTLYKRIFPSSESTEESVNEDNYSIAADSSDESEPSITGTNSTVKISILSTTSALLFPSIAALSGWVISSLFLPKSVSSKISPFYRSLIGASVLVTFKDLSKLLYWYQTVKLRKYRRVLNRIE